MNKEMQYQVESLSSDLIEMLIAEYGWDMQKALDVLYGSQTFAKINDPKCGLYYQGSVYVFDFLKHEMETGKIGYASMR